MKPPHLIDPAAVRAEDIGVGSPGVLADKLVIGSAVALSEATVIPGTSIRGGKITFTSSRFAIFDKSMEIGAAVAAMRAGHRVRRAGWNGKGMHLELQTPDAHSKMSLPYVFMFTACKNRVPWLCSQTDLLAQDWELAEADPVTAEPELPLSPVAAAERAWELAK